MFCERAVWNHSQQIMFTSSFPVFCNIRLRSMLLFWSYSSSKYAFRLMIEVVCVLPFTKVTRQVQTGNWRPSNRRRPKQLWCRKQATNVRMYSWQVFAQYLPSFDVRIKLLDRSHELHHCTLSGQASCVNREAMSRPARAKYASWQ